MSDPDMNLLHRRIWKDVVVPTMYRMLNAISKMLNWCLTARTNNPCSERFFILKFVSHHFSFHTSSNMLK
ncbi:hypothetical protein RO3G_07060 [Rhizopus delemar RA 99-880]|uniref:Uncharacterized protein n=1 Tax=Rhizopus delemar (strain RA 99-880 / ATCC MYA-4621 / FGSC 9543 / NRRL 43880) TaxID=246409 RepID=I1C1M5_RHIO9|nr:hypothetical protein RO3G_07060 [Rhizopus delemar RA 99-880]|eukprot:EIE82355.1 hypothetical protein RO3G_07060 [Rhizopus delemar RA 99-880]